MTKPSECAACPLAKHTTGFCADLVPRAPKIALVTRMPSKSDMVAGEPFSGAAGWHFWKDFIWPLGLQKENVLISNVLRCYPNGGEYPTGKLRVLGTAKCGELWDEALVRYAPNVWGVSVSPTLLYATPNQAKFLQRALVRAKQYADEGKRPCLLLGVEAMNKFAPWLQGGMKQWQGHWWEGM